MTAGTEEKAAERPWQLSAEALALWEKFPPRQVPGGWPATRQPRGKVVARLLEPPFLPASSGTRSRRKLALLKILDWLELHPGRTWQERWNAAGIAPGGWRDVITGQLSAAGLAPLRSGQLDEIPGPGIARLAAADVIRPGLEWLLLASPPPRLAGEMALVRDPEGISRLRELSAAGKVDIRSAGASVERAALIMAAKGGMVADITVGDCLELARASREAFPQQWSPRQRSPFFYQVLHAAGAFPASAPPTVRIFSSHFTGQLTVEQMIDRYDLACRPVRDLLVDYLRERQAGIDYATLSRLALTLGLWFWKDLETHHPGISSLRLPPDIAAAWKQRVRLKNARAGAAEERKSASGALMTVRAFYLDLTQWALDDPARWGPWAVPCPVRADDVQHRKEASRRKSRMDLRTRERLPALPALSAAAGRARQDAAARLEAARGTEPGALFTAGGGELRRAALTHPSPRTWAEDPQTGKRRDLTREEDHAFWAWATVEVLRLTDAFSAGHLLRRKLISVFAQLRG